MRSDFELDSDGWDLVITDDIGIVENAAMTSQDSKFSLQLIQGEVFDDNRIGMPWLTDMVSPQVSIAAKKQIIRDVIMSTPGAIELTRVEVAVDTDSAIATCEFEGITDNGDIFGNQVSEINHPATDSTSGIIATFDYTTRRSTGLRLQRSSTATYIDEDALKTAGVNIPRYENDGLLLEGQSTNVIPTGDLTAWGPSNCTTTAIDNYFYTAIENTASSTHNIGGSSISVTAGLFYTVSMLAKRHASGVKRWLALTVGGTPVSSGHRVTFDLDDGSFTLQNSPISGRTTKKGDYWLCEMQIRVISSGTLTIGARLSDKAVNSLSGWVGDGVSGIVCGCPQVEVGLIATSYIPTSGIAVTRQTDQLSLIKSGAKYLYREYIQLGSSVATKELIPYAGEVVPLNSHLQKLKVWDRDLTANELELLGV